MTATFKAYFVKFGLAYRIRMDTMIALFIFLWQFTD